jgi:hypothetical protein
MVRSQPQRPLHTSADCLPSSRRLTKAFPYPTPELAVRSTGLRLGQSLVRLSHIIMHPLSRIGGDPKRVFYAFDFA